MLIAFASLIFIIFFAALQDRIVTTNTKQANIDLAKMGNMVYVEFLTAERFGNGYQREFYLPPDINGLKYNLSIKNYTTIIVNSSIARTYYFLEEPVIGQVKYGNNQIFSIAGTTYLNINLSEVLNVNIDKRDDDWEALKAWYGILPETDLKGDAFIPEGNPNFPHDLRSVMVWNDNNWLYFRIETFGSDIRDYLQTSTDLGTVDIYIFLDTDLDPKTGYFNLDESELYSELGADYAIFDAREPDLGNLNWQRDNPYPDYNVSRLNPYAFTGSSQDRFNWSVNPVTTNYGAKLGFINDSVMELGVKLSALGLNVAGNPIVGYNVVSRKNGTLVTDYVPGEYDEMRAGYYQLKNR